MYVPSSDLIAVNSQDPRRLKTHEFLLIHAGSRGLCRQPTSVDQFLGRVNPSIPSHFDCDFPFVRFRISSREYLWNGREATAEMLEAKTVRRAAEKGYGSCITI